MMNRRTLVFSGSAVTAIAAAGVTPRLSTVVGQSDSTFTFGALEEPGSLSPLVNLPHHFPADVPQTLMFDSLIQFMPDSTIGPKLATSWEMSEDELTYTFHLAPEARFHDGTPVTAADVVFTFETMQDPASNSSDEGVDVVKSITAIDDHTVEVVLESLTPMFLAQGGSRGIVPKHILQGKDIATDGFNQAPIGNGPYRFVSYTPGEGIVMEAVEDHYRGKPNIDRVVYKVITDQNVILTQLANGEISYGLVTPRDMAALHGKDNITTIEVATPRFFDISPNYERVYWQDQRVRAAILGAINREGIVESILMGHGVVVDANTTPASWAYTDEGITHHPYNPEASAAALDEAGWTLQDNGRRAKDGVELSFGLMLYSYDVTLQQAMLVAQQNLAEIGVGMDLDTVEEGVFGARRKAMEFDAHGRIWNPVYDPDQAALLRTGNTFGGYSNPELDELLKASLASSDQAVRLPIYHEIQQLVSADLPRLFLYSENELHTLASNIDGLAPHPVNVFWNLPTWTIHP